MWPQALNDQTTYHAPASPRILSEPKADQRGFLNCSCLSSTQLCSPRTFLAVLSHFTWHPVSAAVTLLIPTSSLGATITTT